jgi:hypothetical protein
MGWLFLYLHQLVYEKIATMFPDLAGMSGKTKQQIQTIVNHDINALSVAKFGHDTLSKNDRKNNKVGLLLASADLEIGYVSCQDVCFPCSKGQ